MGRLNIAFKNQVIAVDTMIFVYFLEGHPEYFELCAKIFEEAKSVIFSTAGVGELMVGPEKNSREDLKLEFLAFLEGQEKISIRGFGLQEALNFAKLRASYPGLKAPDSIHLSTAICAGAAFFVTHDLKLKKVGHIPVVTLDELR